MNACPEVTQGRGLDGIKAITVQEINEAIRRHAMGFEKPIGLYRNIVDQHQTMPYLAF